ncbi:TVP38/TMEM64 family protein [Salipaludibacillus sp. HK11]|uniref:TVP38/TMEM64 family protein n=1 Tax=Salipaludibacillus sp. HK11 TaxID=3394320 RepID=UPI0039FC044B
MSKKKTSIMKLIILVGAIAIVLLIGWQTGLINHLQEVETMQRFFNDFGLLGYGIYILLFIAVAVFMLPASVMTLVAGVTFGPFIGGMLAMIGGTLGAATAFLVSKYLARAMITNRFKGNKVFENIDKQVEKNGVSFLILTRLVPIFPYNLQNYAYGLTRLPFVKYTVISFVAMAPGSFIYAYMAGQIVREGISPFLMLQFSGAGITLFLLSLIPKYLAKKKGIDMHDLKAR